MVISKNKFRKKIPCRLKEGSEFMDDLKRKSSKKENCLNAGDCIVNEAKSILINNLKNVRKK